jgi:orotidine-5'-phosphate decarboxylase
VFLVNLVLKDIMTKNTLPKIFCAVDTNNIDNAISIAKMVEGTCGIKLGLEFFNAHGVKGVKDVMKSVENTPLFLDLKYHDIPNTVAGAIRAVTHRLTPAYINVHATGGLEMMKAAKEACPEDTKLLAVTVLTSIDADTLDSVGQGNDPKSQVVRLAKLAKEAGCDGVVCSSHEIEFIVEACGKDFITMVPGIRPAGSDQDDQKRIMTPTEAVEKGATHLVIGRPITQSDNPKETIQEILDTL